MSNWMRNSAVLIALIAAVAVGPRVLIEFGYERTAVKVYPSVMLPNIEGKQELFDLRVGMAYEHVVEKLEADKMLVLSTCGTISDQIPINKTNRSWVNVTSDESLRLCLAMSPWIVIAYEKAFLQIDFDDGVVDRLTMRRKDFDF